eukprot:superscaffoldBa00008030_g23025
MAVVSDSPPSCAILGRSETQECVYYNSSWEKERTNRSGIEPCYGEKDKRRHCFATWKNVSGTVEVVKQGCWLDDVNCYDRNGCGGRRPSAGAALTAAPNQTVTPSTSNPFSQKPQLFSTLLYSLVPIIGLAAVVLFSFWMWRHHKLAYPAALVPTH